MSPSEKRRLLLGAGLGMTAMPVVLGSAGLVNMLFRSGKFRKALAGTPDSDKRTLEELKEDGTIPKGSRILRGADEIARAADESDRKLVKNPFRLWYNRVWLNPLLARSVRSGNNALFMGDSGGKPVLAFPDRLIPRGMVAHELGHHRASKLRRSHDDYMREYDSAPNGRLMDLFSPGRLRTSDGRLTRVGLENEAWDLAGVPADNRLRRSAIGTYKSLSLYNSLRKAGLLSSAVGLGLMLYALKKYPRTWYGVVREA